MTNRSETKPLAALLGDHGSSRVRRQAWLEGAGFELLETSDLGSLLEVEGNLRPAALLIAVEPGFDPGGLLETLAQRDSPHAVALCGETSPERALASIRRGVVDWLQADSPDQFTALAWRAMDTAWSKGWGQVATRGEPELGRLTPREHETLEHVLDGLPSKAIAKQMGVTTKTVEQHRSNVMHKLGVASVAQLVLRALKTRTYGVPHLANPRR